MKFKFQAGAEFDMLTKDELTHALKELMEDWRVEAARGPLPILFSASGTVATDGSLDLGGEGASISSGRLGPDGSIVWSVKRLAVQGIDFNVDKLGLYYSSSAPSRFIKPVETYQRFGSDELIVKANDRLLIKGTGLLAAPGTTVWASGAAFELPATMQYALT